MDCLFPGGAGRAQYAAYEPQLKMLAWRARPLFEGALTMTAMPSRCTEYWYTTRSVETVRLHDVHFRAYLVDDILQ